MAKRLVHNYTFIPAERKLVLDGLHHLRRFLLITNATDNQTIFTFNDVANGISSHSLDTVNETTTVILDYDTTGMSSTDELQVFIEGDDTIFRPEEALVDPVHKLRVSNPENLIDTDFEYGLQSSKWETIELSNNIPSFYGKDSEYSLQNISIVRSTQGSDVIRVTTTDPHTLTKGTPIDVQGLNSLTAEGKYLVQAVESTTVFTYKCRAVQAVTANIRTPYTTIVPGQFYTGADVNYVASNGIQTDTANQSTLSVTTPFPHGFNAGAKFYLLNTVSPKTLIIDAAGTTIAEDGFNVIDAANQESATIVPDLTQTNTKATRGAYSLRFNESAVDVDNNLIIWNSHGLRQNDCLMYVKPAGSPAIASTPQLQSLEIYYVANPTDNSFQLSTTENGAAISFTNAGAYQYGPAELMLVYEIQQFALQSFISYSQFRTRAYFTGGANANASGWDLYTNGGFGKMGQRPDYMVPYHRARTSTSTQFAYNTPYRAYATFGTEMYSAQYAGGMTRDTNTTFPHSYNFVEDFTRYESSINFGASNNQFYQYPGNGTLGHYRYTATNSIINLGTGNLYMVPLFRDQESDTFYSPNHGLVSGQNVTFSTTGTPVYYYTMTAGNYTSTFSPSTLNNGTYTVEVANNDRFRLKSGNTSIRIASATGTYSFAATRNRRTANSFYIENHGLSENNQLVTNVDQGGILPSTTSGEVVYASSDTDLDILYGNVSLGVDAFLDSLASRQDLVMDGLSKNSPFRYGSGSVNTTTMNQGFAHNWFFGDPTGGGNWTITDFDSGLWDTGEVEDAALGRIVSAQGYSLKMTPYVKDSTVPFHLAAAKAPFNRNSAMYYSARWNATQTYTLDQRNMGTTNPAVYTTAGVNGVEGGVFTDWRFARMIHYIPNASSRDVIVHAQYYISKDSWDSLNFSAQTLSANTTSGGRNLYSGSAGQNKFYFSLILRIPDVVDTDSTTWLNLDSYIMDTVYQNFRYPALDIGNTYQTTIIDNNRFSLKTLAGVPVDITNVGVSGPAGDTAYIVTNDGTTAYTIDGVSNPQLYLKKGYTYTFTINAAGHPFWLQKTAGAYDAAQLLTTEDGVTNNGTASGTLIYAVPQDAPEAIYYVCQNHSAMGGTVTINSTPASITFLDVSSQIGNLDGVYTVTSVPDTTTFEFATNFKAGVKVLNIVQADQTDNNVIKTSTVHTFADGTPVVYSANNNAPYSGFVEGQTYYVTVIDEQYFSLSETIEDKEGGIYLEIDWIGIPASTHVLSSTTVNGLVAVPDTISVNLGSKLVTGSETSQFLTYYKAGDDLIIKNSSNIPGKLETFKIASVVNDSKINLVTNVTFTEAEAKHLVPTKIYTRPDGATTHRPFDGGVEIIAGSAPGSQIVRQTRKYFRYQSGKGIQISLAINFNPANLAETVITVTDTKCERDIGYIVDGAKFDMALGSTYWAYFNGLAERNSLYLNRAVNDRITKAKNDILALVDVENSVTGSARIDSYFTEILDIVSNGRSVADAPVYPAPTGASTTVIAAKDKILANMTFIEAEINAYVEANYPNSDHDVEKCTRDIKYALYSFAFDVLYGGNRATYNNARFFNYFDSNAETSGIYTTHRQQTIDAYAHLGSILGNIVEGILITPSVGNTATQDISGDNATSVETTMLTELAQIIEDVITYGVGTPGLGSYTETDPSIAWTAGDLQTAVAAIIDNRATLILSYAVKISTRYPHNLSGGQVIILTDSNPEEYNGEHTVTTIIDEFSFQFSLGFTPVQFNPSGIITYRPKGWFNSLLRAGMFDFQNGFFYEYDGQQIYAVRRNSTTQLSGTASVTFGSNYLTGTNTNFNGQLLTGDNIVLRGQTYKVTAILSNTDLIIQPKYKGTTTDGAVITKTIDSKVAQADWNLDKCDGTGSSNFVLDTTKIQMAYMDYSWYGAGKIRFGFKDTYGHVLYVHEFTHNNRETEAYMRSGNLPARYEILNTDTATYIPRLFHWGTSVIMDGTFDDDKAYLFTAKSQTLSFTNGQTLTATTNQNSQLIQNFNFATRTRDWFVQLSFPIAEASKFSTGTPLFTVSGALSGEEVNTTFFSGSNIIVRIFIASQNNTPSFFPIVTTGTIVNIGAPAGGTSDSELIEDIPLISIRLAPSVDNGITGIIGERDIINRMQLQLNQIGLVLTNDCEVTLILNGSLSNVNFQKVQAPSLSNLVVHEKGDTVTGGTPIFSFRASGGTVAGTRRLSNATDFDLKDITDLGNSILGGDGVFPNGPDLLTIAVRVISTSEITATSPFVASGRITWSESQA